MWPYCAIHCVEQYITQFYQMPKGIICPQFFVLAYIGLRPMYSEHSVGFRMITVRNLG